MELSKKLAKHLDLPDDIADLLQENLDEGVANKNLTKMADGSFFSAGVNTEAAEGKREKAKY